MLSPSTSALGAPPTNVATEDERLRQPVGAGLDAVAEADAPLAAVAQQALEPRRVLRRADQQDVPDARQHQRAQRVVHHRLVVHRQQLLAHRKGGRMQPGSAASGEDDSLSFHVSLAPSLDDRRSQFIEQPLDAALPRRHAQPERPFEPAAVQPRVQRATGRRADTRWSARAGLRPARPSRPSRGRVRLRRRSGRTRTSSFRRLQRRDRCLRVRDPPPDSSLREPLTSARRSAPVGAPTWSSITCSTSRSRASRSMVFAKFVPRCA